VLDVGSSGVGRLGFGSRAQRARAVKCQCVGAGRGLGRDMRVTRNCPSPPHTRRQSRWSRRALWARRAASTVWNRARKAPPQALRRRSPRNSPLARAPPPPARVTPDGARPPSRPRCSPSSGAPRSPEAVWWTRRVLPSPAASSARAREAATSCWRWPLAPRRGALPPSAPGPKTQRRKSPWGGWARRRENVQAEVENMSARVWRRRPVLSSLPGSPVGPGAPAQPRSPGQRRRGRQGRGRIAEGEPGVHSAGCAPRVDGERCRSTAR